MTTKLSLTFLLCLLLIAVSLSGCAATGSGSGSTSGVNQRVERSAERAANFNLRTDRLR
jgi:hypothetical protein